MEKPSEINRRAADETRLAQQDMKSAWMGAGATILAAIAIVAVLVQTGPGPSTTDARQTTPLSVAAAPAR